MSDWTVGFGHFIETLMDRKEGNKMVHDLAKSQLKQIFKLFFASSLIGVNLIEDDEGEYGVYIISQKPNELVDLGNSEEEAIAGYMEKYDPDWIIWKHEHTGTWGATYSAGDGNPDNDIEKEYEFGTHNFNTMLKKLFGIFTEQFFDDLNEQYSEYIKYD